jgi:hypothetical protein
MARVAARNDDLAHFANVARVNRLAERLRRRVETSIECEHHAATLALDFVRCGKRLFHVEVDGFLAQNSLAALDGFEHERDVRVRRRADDDRVDIFAFEHACGVRRGFAAQTGSQRSGCTFNRVCYHDQLCIRARGDVASVNATNAAGTEYGDSNHVSLQR